MLSDSFLYDRLMQNAVQQQNAKKDRNRDNSNTSGRGRQQSQNKKKHVIRGKIVQQVILGVKENNQEGTKKGKKSYEGEFYGNKKEHYDFELSNQKIPDKQVFEVMLNEEEEEQKERINETDERILTQQLQYNPELDKLDVTDSQSNIQLLKDQLEGHRESDQ